MDPLCDLSQVLKLILVVNVAERVTGLNFALKINRNHSRIGQVQLMYWRIKFAEMRGEHFALAAISLVSHLQFQQTTGWVSKEHEQWLCIVVHQV